VVSIDTAIAGATIPLRGYVLVAGRNAQPRHRDLLANLKPGDRVDIQVALWPMHPVEAVGGRPMLARDSVIVAEVETEGQDSFRARNPRTALGIANKGRRMILVVIDGRQKPYSDGTTLRETAEIMLALGARDAINLDGGGSSTLAFVAPDTKRVVVANHPSDATGERPVGDALAIVKGCR
jgi:exopolysaccharide biosynthesis protein